MEWLPSFSWLIKKLSAKLERAHRKILILGIVLFDKVWVELKSDRAKKIKNKTRLNQKISINKFHRDYEKAPLNLKIVILKAPIKKQQNLSLPPPYPLIYTRNQRFLLFVRFYRKPLKTPTLKNISSQSTLKIKYSQYRHSNHPHPHHTIPTKPL